MERKNTIYRNRKIDLGVNDEPKYILKLDESRHLSLVVDFHKTYAHSSILPKLLYRDPAGGYILYSYINGTTHYHRGPKSNWLPILVKELLNHYEARLDTELWGRIANPLHSWREINERSLEGARQNVQDILQTEDYDQMKSLIEAISNTVSKYYLHGDTGVHNFVFHDSALQGVIDPSPIIGPAIYDFTYAFCSSPDDLTLDTLLSSFELLRHEPWTKPGSSRKLFFNCIIGLGSALKSIRMTYRNI